MSWRYDSGKKGIGSSIRSGARLAEPGEFSKRAFEW